MCLQAYIVSEEKQQFKYPDYRKSWCLFWSQNQI